LNLSASINEPKLPPSSAEKQSASPIPSFSEHNQDINDDICALLSDLIIQVDEKSKSSDVPPSM
jgi:hypothetical protein